MTRLSAVLASAALGALVAGCASVPKDAGFSEVQETVRRRTGVATGWMTQQEQERAVADRIRALLEKEPDIDAAAAAMRAMLDPEARQAIGARGARSVREQLSTEVVGKAAEQLLAGVRPGVGAAQPVSREGVRERQRGDTQRHLNPV